MSETMVPIISAHNIYKSFGGVVVLKDVNFDIYPGEVHALIGENGAGKSTLMKIVSGVYQKTKGDLLMDGKPVEFKTPHAARAAGIALIHQEPLTFQDLNVVENIFLGHTRDNGKPYIDWAAKKKEAAELLESIDADMKPDDPVRGMSIADQQMIEIASALGQNARVIIMDEPTAALSKGEVDKLFELVEKLKSQGKAIVFIGHRLEEVLQISDRITVLRDGQFVGECFAKDMDQNGLVEMMIGRKMSDLIVKEEAEITDVLLETEGLTYPGKYYDVSIKVRRGEIVGMAGLVGAGRSEVAQAIFGTVPALSGKIKLNGKEITVKHVSDAMNRGIAMVPEDRAKSGLVLPFSIKWNMSFAFLKKIVKNGFVNTRKEAESVDKYSKYLNVKMASVDQAVKELSGGNQQKVVIAKWLLTEPELLILDEPTRGIDVGAKAEVYKLIGELAKQGKAILMISSELTEILQLSDRAYVMCEGHVTAEFTRDELDGSKIMLAASSNKKKREQEVAD